MNFYFEIETNLDEAMPLSFLNKLSHFSTPKDSLNSLTLDLRSIKPTAELPLENLRLVLKKIPENLFNLTIRLDEQIFIQTEPEDFKNTFSDLSLETEVTIELIKFIDHQTDDSNQKILETVHCLKKDSLRKFEVDVFYAPIYKVTDSLVPMEIMLQTLQLTAAQGVNTLVKYINPESSVDILDQIDYWRGFFSHKLNEKFMFNALIPSFESRKSSSQRCFLILRGQSADFQYCIYNRFGLKNQDGLALENLDREMIIRELESSQKRQLRYASQTKSCSECSHLTTCIEGETLSFMKERGLTDCQYPESLVKALSR